MGCLIDYRQYLESYPVKLQKIGFVGMKDSGALEIASEIVNIHAENICNCLNLKIPTIDLRYSYEDEDYKHYGQKDVAGRAVSTIRNSVFYMYIILYVDSMRLAQYTGACVMYALVHELRHIWQYTNDYSGDLEKDAEQYACDFIKKK